MCDKLYKNNKFYMALSSNFYSEKFLLSFSLSFSFVVIWDKHVQTFAKSSLRFLGHWSAQLLDCFHRLELVFAALISRCVRDGGANIDNLAGRLGNRWQVNSSNGNGNSNSNCVCSAIESWEIPIWGGSPVEIDGKLLSWQHLAHAIGPKRANRYFNIIYQ